MKSYLKELVIIKKGKPKRNDSKGYKSIKTNM